MFSELYDGRYRLNEFLGGGMTANVYRAEDQKNGREVALKILDEEKLHEDDTLRLFEREIKAVARLENHPNLLNYYGGSLKEGYHYLVMDIASGETLMHYINRSGGRLPIRDAISFYSQLVNALGYIHKRGVIHRDVKPQNIRIAADGTLKLCDFGIAAIVGAENATRGKAVGTVNYISPEQARGGEVTAASDLYSASVVLYEMVTGVLPFTSDKASPEDRIGEIVRKHLKEAPIRPSHYNPNIPDAVEQIILKGMAKNPLSRFTSAEEILRCLTLYAKTPGIVFDFDLPNEEFDTSAALPKHTVPSAFKPRVKPREKSEKDKKEKPSASGLTRGTLLMITLITLLSLVCAFVIYTTVHGLFFFEDTSRRVLTRSDLLYQSYDEALIASLEREGYDVVTEYRFSPLYPDGTVIAQDPPPLSVQEIGDSEAPRLTLTLSREAAVMTMGEYLGEDYRTVKRSLENLGYTVTVKLIHSQEPSGRIVKTEPASGEITSTAHDIVLTVSKGPNVRYTYLPQFVSKPLAEAEIMAKEQELVLRIVYVDSALARGTVISQNRPYGEKLPIGFYEITLKVSNGLLIPPEVSDDTTSDTVDTPLLPTPGEDER